MVIRQTNRVRLKRLKKQSNRVRNLAAALLALMQIHVLHLLGEKQRAVELRGSKAEQQKKSPRLWLCRPVTKRQKTAKF
jgi:hypothetical protein